jgi:aminoglycoside/choline kinase family phosphotransferase
MTLTTVRIPVGIDEVDPQWLTEVLQADGTVSGPFAITEVRPEQIAMDTGFSSRLYRVHLKGTGATPASVIVKLPAGSDARGAMEIMGGYKREVQFYQRVAGRAPMATPHVYAALLHEHSSEFVLVLEDLRDWDNADHLSGLSLERTQLCIAQLAGLHAWSTASEHADVLAAFPGLDGPVARDLLVPAFSLGWQVYLEKTSAIIPSSMADHASRFAEHAPKALAALTERAMLLHGDIRADNLFFDDNRLKVVDFQFAATGVGTADVGYLVSQGMPTEVRTGRDEELVRGYVSHLAEHGVEDYSFDDAWRHYRFAVAYLVLMPVIALITWDGLSEHSRQLCLTLTDRAVATVAETDALELFS